MNKLNIRIYFEDTDAQGVVYYANYLRFFERARTEYLREVGYGQHALMEEGGIFIVRKIEMKYRKPAKLDDLITIKTKLVKLGKVSFNFVQTAYLDDELLVQAKVSCGCLETDKFIPMRLSNKLFKGMKSLL